MTQDCKYRGKQVLKSEAEDVYHCDGAMARTLEKKPCETGEAHYDGLLNLCRIRKPAAPRNGGAFARLGEGKFA